jgi:hypothetical protein
VRGKGEWTVRVKENDTDEVGSWKETSPKPEQREKETQQKKRRRTEEKGKTRASFSTA